MSSYLSTEQVNQLLRPIHPSRVSQRDGMSHLEAYDVRAHLNRIFGFGRWSADLIDLHLLFETPDTTKGGSAAFAVGYRAIVRLTICAPDGTVLATYTEAATGDAKMPDYKRGDTHDFAIKTAESQALKRCVTNLGDQFGLSLYQKGSRDALVKRTLVMPDGEPVPVEEDVAHDAAPVTPETAEEAHAPASAQATSAQTSAAAEKAPAAPPSTSPDDQVAQQEAERAAVEKLRAAALAVVAPDYAGSRQDRTVALGKINLQAGRGRLLNHPVRMENGEPTTVRVFLDELLKRVQRAA